MLLVWSVQADEELERTLVEGELGLDVDRIAPGESLPAADGDIDVSGLELQSKRSTTHPFGGQHRGARTAKSVEHDIVAPCAVLHRVCHQGDRLDGRSTESSSMRPARKLFTPA